jgi:hypothetical protein
MIGTQSETGDGFTIDADQRTMGMSGLEIDTGGGPPRGIRLRSSIDCSLYIKRERFLRDAKGVSDG